MAAIPDYPQLTAAVSAHLAPLRKDVAPVMKAFSDLGKAALTPGALDEKTKELIALGISVAARCDDCIGFHVRTLARLGASTAEIEETLGVAIYMGGGPSAMYAAHVMAAWQQFNAPAPAAA
jgi:AhpD family alkylhydroperoxidase